MTTGVDVINILQALFHVKVLCVAFLYLQFGFEFFWQNNISKKAACKILMTIIAVYLIYFYFRKFNTIKIFEIKRKCCIPQKWFKVKLYSE